MNDQAQQSATESSAREAWVREPSEPGSLSSLSSEELASRAQEGSLASFGELVDRFEGMLQGYLRRRVGESECEDLAQETFVRAWGSIGRYDPERKFSTWLFTIASRLATDTYRSRTRERKALNARANDSSISKEEVSFDHCETSGEAERIWSVARSILNDEQFSALWLRYAAEMDIADLASSLGKNRVATRVMLFRAREKLAAALITDDGTPASVDHANAPAVVNDSTQETTRTLMVSPGGA